jgi:hypothetical protein
MGNNIYLLRGDKSPYDCDGEVSLPPKDWAHRAARGVIANLDDRSGIGNILDGLDLDIKVEIVDALAEIIRDAHRESGKKGEISAGCISDFEFISTREKRASQYFEQLFQNIDIPNDDSLTEADGKESVKEGDLIHFSKRFYLESNDLDCDDDLDEDAKGSVVGILTMSANLKAGEVTAIGLSIDGNDAPISVNGVPCEISDMRFAVGDFIF